MTVEYWPRILIPGDVMFHIKPMVTAGPPSFSGRRQVSAPDAGFWVATLSDFVLNRPELILEWRGLIAALEGGLTDVIIGPFDCRTTPRVPGKPLVIRGIPHSDGALFSDGSGYRQGSILIRNDGACTLRATSMSVTIQQGELRRGMYFSVYDQGTPRRSRMYMVTSRPVIADGKASFEFLPPLRAAIADNTPLNFSEPRVTMALASADTGQLTVSKRRKGNPSIELWESWNGL